MPKNQEELRREVGVLDVVANVLNINIGSGIFLLPAIIAGILGHASIAAFLLCGVLFSLVVLCYAEISSQITDTGGTYTYIERIWGPFAGFIANTLFWFGTGVLAGAALLNGLADMLSVVFPIFSSRTSRVFCFLLVICFCVFMNIRGVKQGMQVIRVITLIKLLPLIGLIIFSISSLNLENLAWETMPNLDDLGAASLILFFAFIGGESALNISGEMKDPSRTAPLGIIYGTLSIVIFFCLIQLSAQGVLGDDLINHKEAPLAAAARKLFGDVGFGILIAAAMVSIFGTINSVFLLFPRIMYAGAKDKLLPKYLDKIHPVYKSPHWSIITFSIIVFVLTVSGGFKQLAILATASMMLLYLGVIAAVIKIRLQKVIPKDRGFRMPGGLSIPIIAMVALIWFFI